MDAIELLQHDHRMVEQLFRDYHAAASDTQRRGVIELMIRELSRHAALEEMMFYPMVRKALPEGARRADEHLAGHTAVKKLLHDLDKLPAGAAREADLVRRLHGAVEQHIRTDEEELAPEVRDHVPQEDLERLGRLLKQAKQSAPTRPHPGAPDRPPGLTLLGPVAAAYDRLRDRLQGRPST